MQEYVCLECGKPQYSAVDTPEVLYFPKCNMPGCKGEIILAKELGTLELIARGKQNG
jgi:hypothetical protein